VSMNLKCNRMDLWQTPTWVTDVCMSIGPSGKPDGGHNGIRRRYVRWAWARANGVFSDKEQHDLLCDEIRCHVEELRSFKAVRFYSI